MKRRILLILVLAAAVGAGLWYRSSHAAPDGSVLFGNVDIRDVNLGFRVSGRVATMLKDEGDAVQAGEKLAELDAVPFQNRLAEAKAVETPDLRTALVYRFRVVVQDPDHSLRQGMPVTVRLVAPKS